MQPSIPPAVRHGLKTGARQSHLTHYLTYCRHVKRRHSCEEVSAMRAVAQWDSPHRGCWASADKLGLYAGLSKTGALQIIARLAEHKPVLIRQAKGRGRRMYRSLNYGYFRTCWVQVLEATEPTRKAEAAKALLQDINEEQLANGMKIVTPDWFDDAGEMERRRLEIMRQKYEMEEEAG